MATLPSLVVPPTPMELDKFSERVKRLDGLDLARPLRFVRVPSLACLRRYVSNRQQALQQARQKCLRRSVSNQQQAQQNLSFLRSLLPPHLGGPPI